jgi:hypothetical protein
MSTRESSLLADDGESAIFDFEDSADSDLSMVVYVMSTLSLLLSIAKLIPTIIRGNFLLAT